MRKTEFNLVMGKIMEEEAFFREIILAIIPRAKKVEFIRAKIIIQR